MDILSFHFAKDFLKPSSKLNMDVVVSSRVRIARNIVDYPFPERLSNEGKEKVIEVVKEIYKSSTLEKDFWFYDLGEVSLLEKILLVERRLISPMCAQKESGGAVCVRKDLHASIMINEEDHFRFQVLKGGFELSKTLEEVLAIVNKVEKCITYAYHEHHGFLTNCLTNVGTGLRASLMLHLPALAYYKKVRQLSNSLERLGCTIRGFHGEGTSAWGHMFQISNQVTLGTSEQQLVEHLANVAMGVIKEERMMREKIWQDEKTAIEDHIMRAWGTLRYARLMTYKEAIDLMSFVRLGVFLGVLSDDSLLDKLSELTINLQPSHIQVSKGGAVLSPEERDQYRAEQLRLLLNSN